MFSSFAVKRAPSSCRSFASDEDNLIVIGGGCLISRPQIQGISANGVCPAPEDTGAWHKTISQHIPVDRGPSAGTVKRAVGEAASSAICGHGRLDLRRKESFRFRVHNTAKKRVPSSSAIQVNKARVEQTEPDAVRVWIYPPG